MKIELSPEDNILNSLRAKKDKLSLQAADTIQSLFELSRVLLRSVDEMGKVSFERDNMSLQPAQIPKRELQLRLDEITVIALDTFEYLDASVEANNKKKKKRTKKSNGKQALRQQ